MIISDYQMLIHHCAYARWLIALKRLWIANSTSKDDDTTMMFMDRVIDEGTRKAILNMDVMPSMRAM